MGQRAGRNAVVISQVQLASAPCSSSRCSLSLPSPCCFPVVIYPPVLRTHNSGSRMPPAGFFQRHRSIPYYIPNLIGYARIAATLYAFAVAFHHPVACITAYFAAFVCDELDGRAARTFNQQSTLGAVLDMVTDRVSTTGLLALLCALWPRYMLPCVCLIALDIFSHWFQMYASLLSGAATHKDVRSRSWLVRVYYSNRIFMGFCCICCEVLYLCCYLMAFPAYRTAWLVPLPLPPTAVSAAASVAIDYLPGSEQVVVDLIEQFATGVPLVGLLAVLAVPGVLVKQACNWVQLRTAVQQLVEHDQQKMKTK